MENNIEILENIMKPYFDKKREIEGAPAILENQKESTIKEIQGLKQDRISRRKELEIELENLLVKRKIVIEDFEEKKEREIDEYVNQLIDSNPALSSTYVSFIRTDLEQQYNKKLKDIEKEFDLKEEQIVSEIKLLKSVSIEEKNEKQNLEQLNNKLDYNRVDLREIVEIKDELRKKLFAERKRLNSELLDLREEFELYEKNSLELKEKQLNYIEVMDKLSNFKYEYNDQNQVVNSDDWRNLYEESNLISKEIQNLTKSLSDQMDVVHKLNDVNKSLERVEEYIRLMELTKEETDAVMMSMTPWERAEYDRRKAKKNKGVLVEDLSKLLNSYDLEPKKEETIEDKKELNKDKYIDLFEAAYKEIKVEEEQQKLDDVHIYDAEYVDEQPKTIIEKEEDLYNMIYDDIMNEIDNLRSVRMVFDERLNENRYSFEFKENDKQDFEQIGIIDNRLDNGQVIELPSGELINEIDFIEGIKKLYKKNKEEGKTYIVKESEKEYKISKSSIRKFKKILKHCSTFNLIKKKALENVDLIRVHGKEKTDKILKKFNLNLAINKNKTKKSEGRYIEKTEAKNAMRALISKKMPYWLKNITEKLRRNDEKYLSEDMIDIEKQTVKKI